jgi:hypothetical protein
MVIDKAVDLRHALTGIAEGICCSAAEHRIGARKAPLSSPRLRFVFAFRRQASSASREH